MRTLVGAIAPGLSPRRRTQAAKLYVTLLSAVGKHVSEIARSRAEAKRSGAMTAEMFLASLRGSDRSD